MAGFVSLDDEAIAQAGRNAKLNGLVDAATFEHADAFAFLRGLQGGEFDLMVVDPAKQAAQKDARDRALRYYEDLKVDDIADRLGISAGAVKRYLSDAHAKLADALARHEGDVYDPA